MAVLSITKTDSLARVVAIGTLTSTLEVQIDGPSDEQNVAVADTPPAGLTLASTRGCDNDPNGAPSCTLGALAANGDAQHTIEVAVDVPLAALTLSNTASVASDTTDPNHGIYKDSAETAAIDGSSVDSAVEAQVLRLQRLGPRLWRRHDNLEPWTALIPSMVGAYWFPVTNFRQHLIL